MHSSVGAAALSAAEPVTGAGTNTNKDGKHLAGILTKVDAGVNNAKRARLFHRTNIVDSRRHVGAGEIDFVETTAG